jgi:hypothetical protein
MANQKHLKILKQGVDVWNKWRQEHPRIEPDLSGSDLSRAKLYGANFSKADLSYIDISEAHLGYANFNGATLIGAEISGTDLMFTSFLNANLNEASLSGADLFGANLSGADLSDANLSGASLLRTNLKNSILTRCLIYGISVWSVQLEGAEQNSLVITPEDEPTITVDNVKVAQFIYLLLHNKEIREVIDTITSKVVLILGRFTKEHKQVLDALRDELRKRNYSPVLFDFEKPTNRDITETISTLAHMARFVIADITDAKSIPQELMVIIPHLPSVPIQPLILESQHEYGMFEHFTRYPWVLPIYQYKDCTALLAAMKEHIIDPAERKAQELTKRS